MIQRILRIGVHFPNTPLSEHWIRFENFILSIAQNNEDELSINWIFEHTNILPSPNEFDILIRVTNQFEDLPAANSIEAALEHYDLFLCNRHPLQSKIPTAAVPTATKKSILLGKLEKPDKPKNDSRAIAYFDTPAPKTSFLLQSLTHQYNIDVIENEKDLENEITNTKALFLSTNKTQLIQKLSAIAAGQSTPLLAFVSKEQNSRLHFERSCYNLLTVDPEARFSSLTTLLLSCVSNENRKYSEALANSLSFKGVHERVIEHINDMLSKKLKFDFFRPNSTRPFLDQLAQINIPRAIILPTIEEERDKKKGLKNQPTQSGAQRFIQFSIALSPAPFHSQNSIHEEASVCLLDELIFLRHGAPIPPLINKCSQAFKEWDQFAQKALDLRLKIRHSALPFQFILANNYTRTALLNYSTDLNLAKEQAQKALNYYQNDEAYRDNRGAIRQYQSIALWCIGKNQESEYSVREDYIQNPLAQNRYFDLATLGPLAQGELTTALSLMRQDWTLRKMSPPSFVKFASILFRSGKKDEAIDYITNHYLENPNSEAIAAKIALHLRSNYAQSFDSYSPPSTLNQSIQSDISRLLELDSSLKREGIQNIIASLTCSSSHLSREHLTETVNKALSKFPKERQPILAAAFRELGRGDRFTEAKKLAERLKPPFITNLWAEFLASMHRNRALPYSYKTHNARLEGYSAPLDYIKKTLGQDKYSIQLINTLACSLIYTSKTENAQVLFSNAIKRFGRTNIRYCRIALHLWAIGEHDYARHLTTLDHPDQDSTPNDLLSHAFAYGLTGHTAFAHSALKQFSQIATHILDFDTPLPNNLLIWLSLLSKSLGHQNASVKYQNLYLSLEPNNIPSHEWSFLDTSLKQITDPILSYPEIIFPIQMPIPALTL